MTMHRLIACAGLALNYVGTVAGLERYAPVADAPPPAEAVGVAPVDAKQVTLHLHGVAAAERLSDLRLGTFRQLDLGTGGNEDADDVAPQRHRFRRVKHGRTRDGKPYSGGLEAVGYFSANGR